MTVSSTTTKVSYSGDASTAVFAYTFKVFNASEIVVITRVNATGAETTEALNTAYIVDGVDNANGGNVTFKYNTGNPSDPNYSVTDFRPQTGETVVIKRVLPLTQTTDYTPNDPFPAEVHEESLDKLTFMSQQQQEEIDRSFKFAETDAGTASIPVASERANKYLGFDVDGDVIAVDGTTNATPISTFGATLVDDADASAARTTLGLGLLSTLSTVATANITDANVTTAKIADNAITNAKMADDSVGANELVDNSVGADAINISGNGSSGQAIVSDADGSFSYKTLVYQALQSTTGTDSDTGSNVILTRTITPTSTSSKILLMGCMSISVNDGNVGIELKRDSTFLVGSLQRGDGNETIGSGATNAANLNLATFFIDSPNTTSEVSYTMVSDRTQDTAHNSNLIAIEISL
jgi:hypothetical protein